MSSSVLLEVLFASPVVWFPGSTSLLSVEEASAVGAVVLGVILLAFDKEAETAPDADVLWLSFVVPSGVEAVYDTER